MSSIEVQLDHWKTSLLASISIGSLFSRNPVAHKWLTPFRSLLLRETVFWRLHDLLTQSCLLHKQGHGLGARILLRSGFETLATLIYLNQSMQQVLDGKVSFHEFGAKTSKLLHGSKNSATGPKSINIVTVFEKCDRRYPGIMGIYASLSESAHPSLEGLRLGYSKDHRANFETHFSNRWMDLFGDQHLNSIALCMSTFEFEYNEVWGNLFTQLENWIEVNDEELEASKGGEP